MWGVGCPLNRIFLNLFLREGANVASTNLVEVLLLKGAELSCCTNSKNSTKFIGNWKLMVQNASLSLTNTSNKPNEPSEIVLYCQSTSANFWKCQTFSIIVIFSSNYRLILSMSNEFILINNLKRDLRNIYIYIRGSLISF